MFVRIIVKKNNVKLEMQEDYMHVILTDEEQILDAIGKVTNGLSECYADQLSKTVDT